MRGVVAEEGNLVVADFGRTEEAELTKKQLATHLRRTGRWIEQRMAEGMPSRFDGYRRMFLLSECQEWLESHGRSVASA